MKKFFTMLMVGMAVCVSFSSCLFAGKIEDFGKISDLGDNGSELTWKYNAAIAEVTFHYGYKGNTITYHYDEYKYGSALIAKGVYSDIESNDNDKVTIDGKVITHTYSESEYSDWTTEDVRTLYNEMKEGFNLPE